MGDGLQAAWLLARGRPDGLGVLAARGEPALAVAARSFWAAALCLPGFVCLLLIEVSHGNAPGIGAHGFALQLLGYAVDWAAFALISRFVAIGLGKGEEWPRFIAAWNWCNVLQYVAMVAAKLPVLLGLPDLIGDTAWLAVYGWALWLEWYTAKLALGIGGVPAVGFVALDEAMGIVLLGVIQSLNGAS